METIHQSSSSSTETTTHPLDTPWSLWFHFNNDYNWGLDSYHKIATIHTVEEFWSVYSRWNEILPDISENLFFLMKGDIPPIWENELNLSGGCFSFRVAKLNTYSAWTELSMATIGNTLGVDLDTMDSINGISLSAKKHYNIVKIWNNNSSLDTMEQFTQISFLNYEKGIYKKHTDSIQYDKQKKTKSTTTTTTS